MGGFEQVFDHAVDDRVSTNQMVATLTTATAANPPHIPSIALPQTKDDKLSLRPARTQQQNRRATNHYRMPTFLPSAIFMSPTRCLRLSHSFCL